MNQIRLRSTSGRFRLEERPLLILVLDNDFPRSASQRVMLAIARMRQKRKRSRLLSTK
jgi:hypothetical protein